MGRGVPAWSYEKLAKEADLVVIASAVSTETGSDKFTDNIWSVEFVAQITTFKVTHAFKGKADREEIKVLHFKFGEPKKGVDPLEAAIIINGPSLVTFSNKQVTVKVNKGKMTIPKPEYLLFLKKMKDGRYAPVTGQVDPVFSVRQILPGSSFGD